MGLAFDSLTDFLGWFGMRLVVALILSSPSGTAELGAEPTGLQRVPWGTLADDIQRESSETKCKPFDRECRLVFLADKERTLLAAISTSSQPRSFAARPTSRPSREQVIQARRKYRVAVISFDASQRFGVEMPYADHVRLRITNGSNTRLPCLTILTKRYAKGKLVGSSRAPSIPTRDLEPGQTIEYDYYPRGHLDVVRVDKMTVEIEGIIDQDAEQFFCELQGTVK